MDWQSIAQIASTLIAGGAAWKVLETLIQSRGKWKLSKLNADDRIRDDLLGRIDTLENDMKKLYQQHLKYISEANERYQKLLVEKIKLETDDC